MTIKINPDYVHCRIYGHNWDSLEIEFHPKFYLDFLECMNCGTKRTDRVTKGTGLVQTRGYKYPEDYTIKGNKFNKFDRGSLRVGLYDELPEPGEM